MGGSKEVLAGEEGVVGVFRAVITESRFWCSWVAGGRVWVMFWEAATVSMLLKYWVGVLLA